MPGRDEQVSTARGTHLLDAELRVGDVEPTGAHDLALEDEPLERGGVGSKDVAEGAAREIQRQLGLYTLVSELVRRSDAPS